MNELDFLRLTIAVVSGFLARNLKDWFERQYWGWQQLRVARSNLAMARLAFQKRAKGRIVKVGNVVRGPDGREHADEFEIQILPGVPPTAFGPDGEFLRAGYTDAELVEIAKRGKEFSP